MAQRTKGWRMCTGPIPGAIGDPHVEHDHWRIFRSLAHRLVDVRSGASGIRGAQVVGSRGGSAVWWSALCPCVLEQGTHQRKVGWDLTTYPSTVVPLRVPLHSMWSGREGIPCFFGPLGRQSFSTKMVSLFAEGLPLIQDGGQMPELSSAWEVQL